MHWNWAQVTATMTQYLVDDFAQLTVVDGSAELLTGIKKLPQFNQTPFII